MRSLQARFHEAFEGEQAVLQRPVCTPFAGLGGREREGETRINAVPSRSRQPRHSRTVSRPAPPPSNGALRFPIGASLRRRVAFLVGLWWRRGGPSGVAGCTGGGGPLWGCRRRTTRRGLPLTLIRTYHTSTFDAY